MYTNVTLRLDCGSIVRFMNTCYILVVKVIMYGVRVRWT